MFQMGKVQLVSNLILVLKKQHVSNGCKVYLLRSPNGEVERGTTESEFGELNMFMSRKPAHVVNFQAPSCHPCGSIPRNPA